MCDVRIGRLAFGPALLGVSFGLALGLALGLASGACSRRAAPRLKVAVTIFPIYDLTRTMAGPDADVVLLVPTGAPTLARDPSAGPDRAAPLSGARLGIMVGLGLDEWMRTLLDGAEPSAHRLVVGDRVPTLPMRPLEGHPDEAPDPYVWLDPQRALLMSKAIGEELARADPAHAAGYRGRSFALQQRLDALDREVEARVASWSSGSAVSLPPMFAYYGDRYHLPLAARAEPNGLAEAVPQSLDPVGGRKETDTYEKLIRFDTDALEKLVRTSPRRGDSGQPPGPAGSAPP